MSRKHGHRSTKTAKHFDSSDLLRSSKLFCLGLTVELKLSCDYLGLQEVVS